MAHRYWKLKENMGYAGTDSEEEIDLVEFWGNTEKEIEEMSEEEVQNQLDKDAWQQAIEKVDAYAEPIERE